MTEWVYRQAEEPPGGRFFFVCPLRPRCARPPLPKGEARDAHAVHWEVCREARPRLRARRDGFPRQCAPQGHLLRGEHWLRMTSLRGVRGDAPQGYLLRCVGIAPYGRSIEVRSCDVSPSGASRHLPRRGRRGVFRACGQSIGMTSRRRRILPARRRPPWGICPPPSRW